MSRRSRPPTRRSPTSSPGLFLRPEPQPWVPAPYQKVALRFALAHPETALLLEPGMRKTSIALAAFKLLQRSGAARRALVVAPLRVCYLVWTHEGDGELAKWEDFQELDVALLHGPGRAAAAASDADLYVINPDGLEWLTTSGTLEDLLARGVDMLILDELSKFKHTKTKRFKRLKPFLKRFRRRLGLTGSPAANGLLDLFGQAYALDLGKALGEYVTHYRYKYFMPTGFHGYTWVPQEGAEPRIYAAMKDLAISMKATDHLDLPDLVEENVWVDLPRPARKIYDDLEEELLAEVQGETVTAANAAVASMKCRQVASGGLYVDRLVGERVARETRQLHDAKTEALMDLVDELQGAPLLVAYEFQHDLARVTAALKKRRVAYEVIAGGVSPQRSVEIAAAWNRGELPVLVGHPQAMGHGLNLQGAGHHVAWYTVTWDFELYDQTIRRVWRPGNEHRRVFVHRLAARRTVDEVVLAAIARKRRGQLALFDALRRLAAQRHRSSPRATG